MGHRHRRQRLGGCELLVVAFILFVVLQLGVVAIRVLGEVAVLAATVLKWAAMGIAGALAALAVGALLYAVGKGVGALVRRLAGRSRKRKQARHELAGHLEQAREWRGAIRTTVQRLYKRGWLSKVDAKRYRRIADAAITRLRDLEADLATLRALPSAEKWTGRVEKTASTIVERLERTHIALAELLAEAAVEPDVGVATDLRQAADELESLMAAIEDVKHASPMSTGAASPDRASATAGAGSSTRRPETTADQLEL